ncbi:MAG: hypothetical protein C0599_14380 [Salinivirgaceae bacterium]|nr:MAG: hypothetical protein C0599_14380 [Salinivirgaceae bacterium]
MKMRLLAFLFIPFMVLSFISCEEETENDDNKLYVKFENDAGSEYTITSIRIFQLGEAGEAVPETFGVFSENILDAGETIVPGGHVFLTLEIPRQNYAVYRLTVDDVSGNQVYLYEQAGYTNTYDGTITHWGSDDRTVSATVVWNETAQYIYVQGYSDFAGID